MVASYNDQQDGSRDRALSSFSSRGKRGTPATYPDISAPGDRITSACRATLTVCTGFPSYDGGNYQAISGTSMSTPYIAGVVAQLVQLDGARTPGQIEDVLEDTAHRFTAGGSYEVDPRNNDSLTSHDKGHGLVDVQAALTAAPAAAGASPTPTSSSSAASPTPTGSNEGSASPTPTGSNEGSASPTPTDSTGVSSSPTPTGSGAASSPAPESSSPAPPSPEGSSSAPAATTSAATETCPPPVKLRVNTPVINATGLASVSVMGARPGDTIDVQGYSQDHYLTRSFANDSTPRDRTGIADGNGTVTFNDLRLSSNTRLRAQVRGCANGESVVVEVRTLLTLAVRETAPHTYLISGRSLPARAGGLVVSLYQVVGAPCAAGVEPRNCSAERLLGQARADDVSGQYTFRTSFPARLAGQRVSLVLKTGRDGQNAPGRSNVRSLLVGA
jgi:hypothetical protein